MRAAYRPFWYDELVTWHIARLPNVAAMWAANLSGADNNMLLSHLFVRFSQALFGPGYLATRLPALLGFWIMLLALYIFLRRRLPVPFALIGMVFPMLTFAWPYAFEARAYGIVLSCAGIALVAWQNAVDGRARRISLVALATALAVALACHPFAVLLAVPFGLGEVVRSIERRRIDWPVWLSFAAAAPLTLLYPMVVAPTVTIDLHGLQPGYSDLPGFYDAALKTAITPLLGAGAAAYLLLRLFPHHHADEEVKNTFPSQEAAALLGFAVAPALLICVMMASTNMVLFARYGLICVIGLAGFVALMLFRMARGSRRAGWVMFAIVAAWLTMARSREAKSGALDPHAQFEERVPVLARALADGRPVVTDDPLLLAESDFYESDAAVQRLYYVKFDIPRRYPWRDWCDRLVESCQRVIPLRAHAEQWQTFSRRYEQFLLYSGGTRQWIYDALLEGGWQVTLVSHQGQDSLYEVRAPAGRGLQGALR